MQAITLEVILRVVFGVRDAGALERLRSLLGKLLDEGTMLLSSPGAFERDPDGFPPFRRFAAVRAQVDELIFEEVRRRRADPAGDDVLSLLVQSGGEGDDALSDQALRDELMTLLIAGHETTATALAWAFERLTRHPSAMERLRASLEAGHGDYLDAVIKETLRVRPVVMEVGRDITEPVELAGNLLPEGTRVMSSIALVQRSEASWPDAKAFRPERFLDGQPVPTAGSPSGAVPGAASGPASLRRRWRRSSRWSCATSTSCPTIWSPSAPRPATSLRFRLAERG